MTSNLYAAIAGASMLLAQPMKEGIAQVQEQSKAPFEQNMNMLDIGAVVGGELRLFSTKSDPKNCNGAHAAMVMQAIYFERGVVHMHYHDCGIDGTLDAYSFQGESSDKTQMMVGYGTKTIEHVIVKTPSVDRDMEFAQKEGQWEQYQSLFKEVIKALKETQPKKEKKRQFDYRTT